MTTPQNHREKNEISPIGALLLISLLVGLIFLAPGPARAQETRETQGIKLRLIPGGTYLLGSPANEPGRYADEAQPHRVKVKPFYLGVTAVTNAQYARFLKATGHRPPLYWRDKTLNAPNQPVVGVTWEDAVAFCQWLTKVSGVLYRLPTEQEWERAARGTAGLRYPWGNEWDEKRANTQEAGHGMTTPVGQYSPDGDSPEGCADMVGNVWEWTDSPFEPYAGSSYQDEYYGQGLKVFRGGSYYDDKTTARAACRDGNVIHYRDRNNGFRVVVGAASSPLDSESSEVSN